MAKGKARRGGAWAVAVAVAVVGAIVVGVVALRPHDTDAGPLITGLPYFPEAYEGQDSWARPLWDEQAGYGMDPAPETFVRNPDHEGLFSVHDGIRASLEVDDPGLVVWFFGGSTMFGFGQRDEHTIPSEIVRSAAADGHRIEAVNFGTPTWAIWQEAAELDRRLAQGPPPDLVVFYDGCNDWANFVQLLGAGRNVDYAWAIGSPFDANPKEPEPKTPAERTARLLRYAKVPNQALGDVQDLAAEHGFDLVRFWQPVAQAARWNPKETRTLDRLDISLDDVPERRREYQALREAIGPPDAIDVSDALDELDAPVYLDWCHTNEVGSKLVADAMYEELGPLIARLDDDR